MRKHLALTAFTLLSLCATAQNIQLHYDFGGSIYSKDLDGRPALTSTVEMFRPDKWGSTFFFIDMDYKSEGIVSGYWEIARELQFWQNPFSVHVEYNGGLTKSFPFQNAYLLGGTYTYNSQDFKKGFTFTPMYKYIQKHDSPHNFQLTATWYLHFAREGLCTFSGFADWWREKTSVGDFIFMAEPQFWVNLNKIKGIDENFNLSVGSEVELTYNFANRDGFYAIPTVAIKWTFK
ncbi:hypothetical protein M2459_002119 [Parabacteroides sp. PF5-5]|uniref:nucleoside-specific channel-forming Tsx family protein n=1 Tax=unclassified Parabacteroides TaxID=2649774 RepID=UPI0024757F95|nr:MULTISPECIES: DUF5020 family protein [unclassified Parabacteroides]MDH6306864.1 hypothetical protein [Parabacteroides sp. PH5-39]MDH6316310.1 hypothetical protein [Parabacteroides sp. PF5-13]MDH6319793.1 hypothetical protein [Parabacteroides sp. PH5-13]MDH6323616.1 hypothetical protein [Parabacteroides sp. PH5-8]MDH6327497.1 hypothetical protein [Parabacteroides sp. PH5-41]